MREVFTWRQNWRFRRAACPQGADIGLDDRAWEQVRVPHDWAIAGPFDREHDLQRTLIVEDGEQKVSEHVGRTGGLPHVGEAWYRRAFEVPGSWAEKRLWLELDGVMSRSTVFVNGQRVGAWPYGYASFNFEISAFVRPGRNVVAVHVNNPPNASRWYPGAGIYRHVRLVVTSALRIAPWGVTVTTPSIADDRAAVTVRTEVLPAAAPAPFEMSTEILDPAGSQVARTDCRGTAADTTLEQSLEVPRPRRWDVDDPALYCARTRLYRDNTLVDETCSRFGFRELRFDADRGFFLNGRALKLRGVCRHHDLGALGAAVARPAIRRQLDILGDMGCNAIRTSHNPPAPELLELCDELGFLVIDEAFDEWQCAKVENGYHALFDEWAERDLRAFIRRDRNHPCVIMWSIGNEIGEQGRKHGAEVARMLTDICHEEDPTRPVTAGFNNPNGAIRNGLADVVDIPGWNYKCRRYREYHNAHPDWVTYGSETESCLSSRGEYFFPVREERDARRPTGQVSSYDLAAPPWGYSPDYELAAQEDCPFSLGEFVWTGFDYLGEPTPYKTEWPSRSSYFGIVDLAGLPKDRFFLYRSAWSSSPTLHLLPHWTWPGREGQTTPVHCYTSYPQAELFLNGRSLGVRRKARGALFGSFRLIWDGVLYEPGTLKVVARNEQGNPVASVEQRTAGAPAQLVLETDRQEFAADGDDLAFITVRMLDEHGIPCPWADNLVRFTLDGPGEVAGVDNGDPTGLESFVEPRRHLFHGYCVLIVRSVPGEAGAIRVIAQTDGLATAAITLHSER